MAEKTTRRDDSDYMYVLRLQDCYGYKIPGFEVLKIQLRHARVQRIDRDGYAELLDCLLNEDLASDLHPPAAIKVLEDCTIQAENFMAQFPESPINVADDCIFVIWKGQCNEIAAVQDDSEQEHTIEEEGSLEEGDDDDDEDSTALGAVPHTVIFKCIGASRDTHSQVVLRTARDMIANGETVPVRMIPEPTNMVDSRAIVFECQVEKKWSKIGYVVSEVLDPVHAAIRSNTIVSVEFRCVRYVTHWSASGPGYYAAISVTKMGPWDRIVKRYQSTIQ